MKGLDKMSTGEETFWQKSSEKADEGGHQVGALAMLIIRKDLHKQGMREKTARYSVGMPK